MTYQIEKGVPIPEPVTGKGTIRPQSVMGALRQMKVGESRIIDRPQKEGPVHSKLIGMKFTTRKVSENQTRIWRVA